MARCKFKMQRAIEQQIVGFRKCGMETLGLLYQMFKNESMSNLCFKWHKPLYELRVCVQVIVRFKDDLMLDVHRYQDLTRMYNLFMKCEFSCLLVKCANICKL